MSGTGISRASAIQTTMFLRMVSPVFVTPKT